MLELLEYEHSQKKKLDDVMKCVNTVINIRMMEHGDEWEDVAKYVIEKVSDISNEYPGIITSGDDFRQLQILVMLINDSDKPHVSDWVF